MTTLINKSNHPVNIKKINIRVWTLRDEIEACIQARVEEQGSENVDIEDIRAFYSSLVPKNGAPDELDDDPSEKAADSSQEEGQGQEENKEEDKEEAESSEQEDSQKSEASEQVNEASEQVNEASEQVNEASEQVKDMADTVMSGRGKSDSQGSPDFKRVRPPQEKMVSGFAFLSEIHMDQILFFGKRPYTTGQNIVIEFLIPNKFSVSAEVAASLHIDRTSRIISETKPSHRIQGAFTFLFDGERGDLRGFLKSVEPDIPPPPKKLKKQESEEEDEDDFDDLGF